MAEDTEIKDDAALGRTLRITVTTIAQSPKAWVIIAAALGWGWMQKGSMDQGAMLQKISADVVEVKIKTNAIMSTLPDPQKKKAILQAEQQMAAVKMSKEMQP